MISLADLKAYLGIDSDDTSEDAVLTTLEANAVAFIQTQTRRYFGPPEEFEEILTGDGSRTLWLSEQPIDAPDDQYAIEGKVAVDEREYPGADETALVAGEDFEVRTAGNEGRLVRLGSSGKWKCEYEYICTYWRGYPEGEEPKDIRQLVLDLVSTRRSIKGMEALRSETAPDYSYTRFGEGDLDAIPGGRDTIAAWRRLVFA